MVQKKKTKTVWNPLCIPYYVITLHFWFLSLFSFLFKHEGLSILRYIRGTDRKLKIKRKQNRKSKFRLHFFIWNASRFSKLSMFFIWWTVFELCSFEFKWKSMKNITKYRFPQKLKPKLENLHEQDVFLFNFHV